MRKNDICLKKNLYFPFYKNTEWIEKNEVGSSSCTVDPKV